MIPRWLCTLEQNRCLSSYHARDRRHVLQRLWCTQAHCTCQHRRASHRPHPSCRGQNSPGLSKPYPILPHLDGVAVKVVAVLVLHHQSSRHQVRRNFFCPHIYRRKAAVSESPPCFHCNYRQILRLHHSRQPPAGLVATLVRVLPQSSTRPRCYRCRRLHRTTLCRREHG